MILNINGHKVEFRAGIRFLEELDRKYKMEQEGFKVDFGLNQLYINFTMDSYPTLKYAIWAGTRTDKEYKPTLEEVEEFIENHEDIEQLFEKIKQEVRESNMTKKAWANMEENTKKEQERMNKMREELLETQTTKS